MKKEIVTNEEECYLRAEVKALDYFTMLQEQVTNKKYRTTILNDIDAWKGNHRPTSRLQRFAKQKIKPIQRYPQYLHWLTQNGKLEQYLERSISYIFLRDLGKPLHSPATQKRIRDIIQQLKNNITSATETVENDLFAQFNKVAIYRQAEQEGLELTVIWLFEKLAMIAKKLPKQLDPVNAQRKLLKIIGGVVMHLKEELGEEVTKEERTEKLSKAIRLGYAYGLTYPFIDDLLDSSLLSQEDKQRYSSLIRTTLLTGNTPPLKQWEGPNGELIQYIYSELKEAFSYIQTSQPLQRRENFFEQAFIFFQSQEVDRNKQLSHSQYTNEELYVPVILKSAYSRLIARSIINDEEDEGFGERIFYYGIYNQLADDFSDMFDDMNRGAVTPYTYYLTYYDKRNDLINPFELYWAVILNLMTEVYDNDSKTRDVLFSRAINGLRRFKEKVGEEKYDELMGIFTSDMPQFNKVLQQVVKKVDDVDFYDKLVRDHMIVLLQQEETEREQFKETVQHVRNQLNAELPINENDLFEGSIVDAANYSVKSGGKRLRPVLTWLMGVEGFDLQETSIYPLLKSLEYMHTASLIFDDLPAQDNAQTRRGKPTLHVHYNESIAQLTGLFLTQKAYEEQTTLSEYNAEVVLELIRYSSIVTAMMCKGQAMDLHAKGKSFTIEQLTTMCFYKTGLGFEASLVMPAILAQIPHSEIEKLKKFAKHAGIAFQIKDDLLDVEGEFALLGKRIGIDEQNNRSTFVSVLGKEEAKKMMWEHYCIAAETVQTLPYDMPFLKHFLDLIVTRNH